jgi:hypothetical protein
MLMVGMGCQCFFLVGVCLMTVIVQALNICLIDLAKGSQQKNGRSVFFSTEIVISRLTSSTLRKPHPTAPDLICLGVSIFANSNKEHSRTLRREVVLASNQMDEYTILSYS